MNVDRGLDVLHVLLLVDCLRLLLLLAALLLAVQRLASPLWFIAQTMNKARLSGFSGARWPAKVMLFFALGTGFGPRFPLILVTFLFAAAWGGFSTLDPEPVRPPFLLGGFST